RVYHESGEYEKAVAHYRSAIRLDPDESADAHYSLGVIFREQGLHDKAAKEFRAALKVDQGYKEAEKELDSLLQRKDR
ncbi:MAG TPA: tetratricopeptide repeat protein, partial [Gammaproteobacteria bacterium]|nr:tetratricopeptide repeat protein [Gammaproteobacteria bacterium]